MILYQDTDWLAIDKVTGLSTHAAQVGALGAVEWLELHHNLKTYIVSRLDRDTSGVLLLALNPEAAARAQTIHEQNTAQKTYEFFSAVDSKALGLPSTWTCEEPLDGKTCHTEFQRLGQVHHRTQKQPPLYHYQAVIHRGRRHQVRRHAAAAGLPLLGDQKYDGRPWSRLCLHCAEVSWPEIETPLRAEQPPSFTTVLSGDWVQIDLAVCRDRRGAWLASITDAWRLVHRDEIQNLPAAIDLYGQWFNATWFDETQPPDALQPLLSKIMTDYNLVGGIIRTHRRNPHQRGLVTETVIVGQAPPETFAVTEHGIQYEVNLTKTQHTGLFLDQRDSRRRLAKTADGARVANLFAFTCSFSCVAVAHGADVVFSVDTAKPCLNTGKRNFELNSFTQLGKGKFIQEDARKWLRRQLKRKTQRPEDFQPLDLIVCDPPVFASAKDGGQFSVAEAWPFLAEAAAALLSSDGLAIFANNHRTGDARFYRDVLARHFGQVTHVKPPLDFPVLPGRPAHVRTYWCTADTSKALTQAS